VSTRSRAVIAIVLLVAAVVGVLLWRSRSDDTTSSPEAGATHGPVQLHAKDPVTGAPRWFGQSGVGGRRIAGLVLGEDGAPVRGATVGLASAFTMSGLSPEPSAITDGSGHFDFGVQPAAAYVVVAMMPRLTGVLHQLDLRDSTASPPPDQLRLVLHACDASIHGTIRDSAGGVIVGALVTLGARALRTTAGAEADVNGNYELCVPVGGAGVTVTADGYAALSDNVSVYGRTRHDFALIPGASVVGRVVRADDRSAVAGAVVELRSHDPQNQGALLVASSDAEGRFLFDGVAPGRHVIRARTERLATRRPVDVIAEIGKPAEDVVCELAAALTVSGKVIERVSGTPIAGTRVHLVSRTSEMTQPLHAVSQPDGTFVIDHVFPGAYQAVVQNHTDDKPLPSVKLEGVDVSGVVIELEQGATISGRILYAGKPVHGARVNAAGTSTESDHDGRYTLRGLPAGTLEIYAESQRVGAFTRSPSVTVAKGEQRTGVDVVLDLSGSIAGIVVDQNDAPVAGVFLRFSLLHGRDFGLATTADDGSFTARSLSGGGEYVYEVRQRAGSALSYAPASGKRYPPIAVRDGQSHVTGVRVKIRLERFSIAGRITDAAGNPVSDATIRAVAGEAWYRMPTATSDESGAFTIRDLPAGTYTLHASTARGDARADQVAAGRTDVALRLLELGGIDGTLEGFASTPEVMAHRVDAGGVQHRAVVTGNTFQLRNLPAGKYLLLTASSSTEGEYANVVVSPGTTMKVTVRKREVGVITGTVIDEKSRAPLAGIYCTSSRRGGDPLSTYERAPSTVTDTSGAFRIERAPVGINFIACNGSEGSSASGEANVTTGQVTRVELTARTHKASRRGDAGLTLEEQLGEVMVKSVESGGPGARAGVLVGDVLLKVGDMAVDRWGSEAASYAIEYGSIDTPKQLTLERGDKQLTVLLTLVAAP